MPRFKPQIRHQKEICRNISSTVSSQQITQVTYDLAISVGIKHQWFPEQQLILDEIHEIRLGVNYDLG